MREDSCHRAHFIPQFCHGNPKPCPGGGMVYAADLKSPADKQALAAKEQLTVAEKKFLSTFLSTPLALRSKRIWISWDDWMVDMITGSADDFDGRGIVDQGPLFSTVPILAATRDEHLPRCRNSHAPRFEFVRARKINRPTRAGPQPPARDITPMMPRVLGTERGGQRPSFKHALKPRAGAIGCDHASVHLRPRGG
ncbi:MAG: hypothetical protein RL091_128 [Verrucomicrobiota bacterium]